MTENEFIDWFYGTSKHDTEGIDGGSYEFTVDGYRFVTRPARNGNYCTLYDVSGDRRACAQWSEKADLAHGIIDEYGKLSGLNDKSIQTWVRVEQMCRNYAEGAKE